MKKLNFMGFSAVEALLLLVILGIIGFAGWKVYGFNKDTTLSDAPSSVANTQKEETKKEEETKKSINYSFKELGIAMDILDGWEVKTNHTKEEGVNFYNWTVEKAGADGKIDLSSYGFRGGFEDCGLVSVSVSEVAMTKNPKLMFMAWSYKSDNKDTYRTAIIRTDSKSFKLTNDEQADEILSSELKSGNYYFCSYYLGPGFDIDLNDEPAPGYSRKTSIKAFPNPKSDSDYTELPNSAKSYNDIKEMLLSIK